jgi:small conductance mechanosensitive channel
MDKLELVFNKIMEFKIIHSLVIIVLSLFIYKGIVYFIEKSEESIFNGKKSKTYIRLVKSIIRYIVIIITLLILLQNYGVDVSSVLAGVGLLGVIIGLAIQDWLKDIIRGSSILSDHYFAVGDVVKYGDIEAKVLVIGLKTTKIQDLRTDNIISIANRNIEQIEVVSNLVNINIPMPYEVKLDKAELAIKEIINKVKEIDHVTDCIYASVNELDDSSINYLIKIRCNPLNKLQIRRDTLHIILEVLDKHNIEVPYQQIDIHNK